MNLSDITLISDEAITVRKMAGFFRISQSIYVVAKLGIADLLKDSPKHCDDLAKATNSHSNSLYRLLRALASIGIFAETQTKYFQLTPRAACLVSNSPSSMRSGIMMLAEQQYACWENLLHSIQTGENAFEHLYGMNFFEYCKQNPDSALIFDGAMAELSAINNPFVVAAYDFSSTGKLVDVGGGTGSLLAAILQRHPSFRGCCLINPISLTKHGNCSKQRE